MKGKYIGPKKVSSIEETEDKTPGGFKLIKVSYEDESIEYLSELMFNKVISDEKCDESELREKRVQPIVESMLAILRDWGLKVGELQYMSALLNQSLNFNSDEALIELLSKWMPRPKNLDDVDYVTIDRILRSEEMKPVE